MSLLPLAPPTLVEKNKFLIIAAAVFVIVFSLSVYGLHRAKVHLNDVAKVAEINQLGNSFNLYYSLFNDFPPAEVQSGSFILGQGAASCLDETSQGFRESCDKKIIRRSLPEGLVYKKTAPGVYHIDFKLEISVAGLRDQNKDGVITCQLKTEGISCF